MSKFIKFIGYTIGLECNGHGKIGKMVKVAFYRNEDGTVTLAPESGRNMSKLPGARTISAEEYADRPDPILNDVAEARWAMERCGYKLMAEDYA